MRLIFLYGQFATSCLFLCYSTNLTPSFGYIEMSLITILKTIFGQEIVLRLKRQIFPTLITGKDGYFNIKNFFFRTTILPNNRKQEK